MQIVYKSKKPKRDALERWRPGPLDVSACARMLISVFLTGDAAQVPIVAAGLYMFAASCVLSRLDRLHCG